MIERNIFRNVYDAGFTLQGYAGSYDNTIVRDNIFINCEFATELWTTHDAESITNYEQYNNISINTGRGWGHERETYERQGIFQSGEYVLFFFHEDSEFNIHHNIFFNPRRLYVMWQDLEENFKSSFATDYNTLFISPDDYLLNISNHSLDYNDMEETILTVLRVSKFDGE